MNTPGFPWAPLATLLVPLTFGLGALLSGRAGVARPFRLATRASAFALLLALLSAAAYATGAGPREVPAPWLAAFLARNVRADATTELVLLLVCLLAAIIVRFSKTYLVGEPGQGRYARWLMGTLTAVTALVGTSQLLVLAIAWTATSLTLHQLLTFYQERRQALIAAHKKFLVSRLAEVCLFAAVALVAAEVGSLQLDDIQAHVEAQPHLSGLLRGAAVLFAIGAALKSAQLPFHGWLTQVMEAPTPVSALLHAGVVNLGGFLMLRLAPLMCRAPLAQTLLVFLGSITALIGALVMTTRISIKVRLAWSTIAQMGFMLIECGLGLYTLALLHLLAHSLYKAHAFLSAGGAVEGWQADAAAPETEPLGMGAWMVGAVAALTAAGACTAVGHGSRPAWELAFPLGVLALGMVPMLVRGARSGRLVLPLAMAASLGLLGLALGLHALFSSIAFPMVPSVPWVRLAIAAAALFAIFAGQAALTTAPNGKLARYLAPRLFAGLYLDELFTRLTFRIWPVSLPTAPQRTLAPHPVRAQEA